MSSCRCVDCRDFEHSECLFEREIAEKERLRAELEAANSEVEQLRVQLAGCGVAALGGTSEPANKGDYGWSPAYQDVLSLRQKLEDSWAEIERLKQR